MTSVEQAVAAAADLVGRAGATSFEIGWDCPHVPGADEKTHGCGEETWWAAAYYKGGRVMVDSYPQPDQAATALVVRLMTGATCRCTRPVILDDQSGFGCRWSLVGDRWEPGCDAPSVPVHGAQRGDLKAMREALKKVPKIDSQG